MADQNITPLPTLQIGDFRDMKPADVLRWFAEETSLDTRRVGQVVAASMVDLEDEDGDAFMIFVDAADGDTCLFWTSGESELKRPWAAHTPVRREGETVAADMLAHYVRSVCRTAASNDLDELEALYSTLRARVHERHLLSLQGDMFAA